MCYTDSNDKYDIQNMKSYNDKIDKVITSIGDLFVEELDIIHKNKKLTWILDFWKRVIRINTPTPNVSTVKIQRPNATMCTWFDIDIKKETFIHKSDENYDVIRYFLFHTTGKCLRLHSGACLSWYASKLEHGTSCTIVRNITSKRVYYLGLSEQAPVTTVAWGESKPKNKEYIS